MSDKYSLDEQGEPKPCEDLMEWAKLFDDQKNRRIVKQDVFGDAKVSTVFLAINHSYGDTPPVLWETMVFGGKMDQEQDRCGGSRADAMAMHERMVAEVKSTL